MVKTTPWQDDYMTLWALRKFHRNRIGGLDWYPSARPTPFGTYSWVIDEGLHLTGPFLWLRKIWGRARRVERYERGAP